MAQAASQASRYYLSFLDTFRQPSGPGGRLPTSERLPDPDNERYVLLAAFSLGRVLHKSAGAAA